MIEDLNLLADRYDALAEHLEAANSDNSEGDARLPPGSARQED